MKICQFSSTSVDGGYFEGLAQGLTSVGHELFYVSLREARPPTWLERYPSITYRTLGTTARWQYLLAVLRLAHWLRRERVSILHLHLYDAGLVGLLAAFLAGVPVRLLSRHHLDETWLLGTRLTVELDRWMARRADCVIVPTQAVRQHMLEKEALAEVQIEVIPYGFQFEVLTADELAGQRVRGELGLDGAFVLGNVGRLVHNKGHRYLFQAVKALLPEIPNLRVLLVGDGERALIEGLVAELGLQEHVVFAGFRRDVAACMKAMDVLVHPSLSESFGQVLVEAMCVGTPVVASAIGGIPEIVSHERTGLLVPVADAAALEIAIRRLHAQPAWRVALGVAGQASVYERFSRELMMQRYLEIYRRYEHEPSEKTYVAA